MKRPNTREAMMAQPAVNLPPPDRWPESDVLPTNGPVTETCPHGHPRSAENTYTDPNGYRRCRTCQRAQRAAHKADPDYRPNPYRNRTPGAGRGKPRYVVGGVCHQGHSLDAGNAYVSKIGVRCRTCRAGWSKNYTASQARKTQELQQQARHTDHYSLLPKIELFYSEQDKVWIARFRNTSTLDGLSGLGNSIAYALIDLTIAYGGAHGSPAKGGELMAGADIQEVPDANTP